jgi:hypothetical protein
MFGGYRSIAAGNAAVASGRRKPCPADILPVDNGYADRSSENRLGRDVPLRLQLPAIHIAT